VTVSDWTQDQLVLLATLRRDLEPLGVVYLRTMGGQQVYVPELLEPHVRRRLAESAPEASTMKPDELVSGEPYARADYEAAGKLYAAQKMTVEGIRKRRDLSTKRAHRLHRQFNKGAVVYDNGSVRPGRGYRWDPGLLDDDPPKYKLIRG
jgi:hypothetical protein